MALGLRDLTTSASATLASQRAGVANGAMDIAELHAPFTHQEIILRDAIGIGELHIGNWLGAVKNWVTLQYSYETLFCVVARSGQDPVVVNLEIAGADQPTVVWFDAGHPRPT